MLMEDVVYRKFERSDGTNWYLQLLLPKSLRQRFLEMVHAQATGHFAYKKTLVQERFLGLLEDGRQAVLCMLQGLYWVAQGTCTQAGWPEALVCWDTYGSLTRRLDGSSCRKVIVTACDSFTRFVIAVSLRDETAFSVARALVHEVVLKFAIPTLAVSFRTSCGIRCLSCCVSVVCAQRHAVLQLTGKLRDGIVLCIPWWPKSWMWSRRSGRNFCLLSRQPTIRM